MTTAIGYFRNVSDWADQFLLAFSTQTMHYSAIKRAYPIHFMSVAIFLFIKQMKIPLILET